MPKKTKTVIVRIIFFILCISVIISAPIVMSVNANEKKNSSENAMTMLTVWQIDSFEGGKGSRANYLQTVGNECFKNSNTYVNVVSITAFAARENILAGNTPDLISYGAGTYGIESIIYGKTPYFTWAHGGYCFLTLDENADFSDIDCQNTIVNKGVDNLSAAAALFCGVEKATVEKPTGAYVSLIQGEYKYLLGTQRDIFRLQTRQVNFKVKPITEFNDLYQNISVTTSDANKAALANRFIEFLLNQGDNIAKLGLMGNGKYYDDEMSKMENLNYNCKLISPISESAHMELLSTIGKSDINLLKKLLK